jgi:F-type H+-transporting ATPase subunit gamma
MANLKEIRIRLNSVKSTRQITSAMKMVSAAKLRKAQESILQLRPFYIKLHEILKHVSDSIDDDHENVFARSTATGRVLLIVITSNRGLCGAFNSNIVKRAIQCIHEQYNEAYQAGKLDIIAIGKKGADQLKSKNYPVTATYHNLFEKLSFDPSSKVSNQFIQEFLGQKYSIIKLIYESPADYILEPSATEILDEMIPYTLGVQFFRALLESNASEHGARMTAMHKATDNATDIIRGLELTYNKARQAAITNEILEIVGGAEALKK